MLKIGEVSKLKNISTKALRYYDRIGLLQLGNTDSKTSYRLYNDEDIKKLSKIMILKEAGFSLKHIKNLICNGLSVQELIEVLKNKRYEIKKEIEEKTKQMEYIHKNVLELIHWESPLISEEIKDEIDIIKVYPASKHYDLLSTIEPDPPILKKYMEQWDGHLFMNEIEPIAGLKCLEIGIGLGRVAKKVLRAGGKVTGIDTSLKSLECTQHTLKDYKEELVLINQNIESYSSEGEFDIAYSVLTFCHIQDKRKAIKNIVKSIKIGGKVVLSIESPDDNYKNSIWVDGNVRYKPEYYPNDPEKIIDILKEMNCKILKVANLEKNMPDEVSKTTGETIARLIVAQKL